MGFKKNYKLKYGNSLKCENSNLIKRKNDLKNLIKENWKAWKKSINNEKELNNNNI